MFIVIYIRLTFFFHSYNKYGGKRNISIMHPLFLYYVFPVLLLLIVSNRGVQRRNSQYTLASTILPKNLTPIRVYYMDKTPVTVQYRAGESVALVVTARVGSRHEVVGRRGVSHFLEHLLFKGSKHKNYRKATDISKAMNRIGAVFNAFTSQEQTSYYCKVPVKSVQVAFEILSQMLCCPLIRDKDVKTERTVVVQEIRKYKDMPERRVREIAEQRVFRGHSLGEDIAGSEEEIMNMPVDYIRGFFANYYAPPNLIISVSGAVDPRWALKATKKYFQTPSNTFANNRALVNVPVPNVIAREHYTPVPRPPAERWYWEKQDTEQCHVCISFPVAFGYDNNMQCKVGEVLSTLLGGYMSSRLWVAIREQRGLAYSVSATFQSFAETGMFSVCMGLQMETCAEGMALAAEEILRAAGEEGITAEELARAKGYLHGSSMLSMENSIDHAFHATHEIMYASTPPREVKSALQDTLETSQVSQEAVQKLARRILTRENMYVTYIGPKDESSWWKAMWVEKKISNVTKHG